RARRGRTELADQVEWVVGIKAVGVAIEAHLPGRAMTDHRVLLVLQDRVLAHAGKIIVGLVVGAHVIEAEAPVFPLMHPPLRRAVRRHQAASRMIAHRRMVARTAILRGLHPNAIKEGRVELHDRPLCGRGKRTRKLDKTKSRAADRAFFPRLTGCPLLANPAPWREPSISSRRS